MSVLRFRELRLRVQTARGRFGSDIPLSNGLMLLRADNSRGKSTAIQSILFALGLERMMTTRPTQSLTSAMRDTIIYDSESKGETSVLSSWVSLEIEGIDGVAATVTRWVKDDKYDSGLVRVVNGAQLSDPGDYPTHDYYVGRAGAVANPRGFHRWLADFMGWEMPDLPASDGRFSSLYMEQVFPLLFVEQRRGWGGIQAQMPYFSGVSDVRRRSIEFLLNLDVGKLEARRLMLRARESKLQDDWRSAIRTFGELIRGQGLTTIGVPQGMALSWPPSELPMVVESQDSEWIDLDALLSRSVSELDALEKIQIPAVGETEDDSESRLKSVIDETDGLRQRAAVARDEILRDRGELQSVTDRIAALREDLRAHQDIVTLERLGSGDLDRLHGECPVCHQQLPTSLLGTERPAEAMSPSDTVAYLRQQLELFEAMRRDSSRALSAKQEQWSAIQSRMADLRSQIRAIRTTLTEAVGTPSIEAVTRRVRLQERIDRLRSVREAFFDMLGQLDRIADAARAVRAEMQELPDDRVSSVDRSKLQYLERSFVAQLHEYDFGSFSDERLSISEDDYLPRREEFDLQADISASDSIRVVWAYLIGLMEVDGEYETNHPGFLVFDEPRQQSTKSVSFQALLRRAATIAESRQIIFATSEDLGSLRGMLANLPHTLHSIDGYVLKPISE